MLPIKDENPHPPGFKPKLTYAFIAINVIVFFFEVSVTGEFFEFTNANAAKLFYEWGAVPACIVGESHIAAGSYTIPCPVTPYVTLLSSTFLHGGLMHLGGNMLFLWIFGDNIEAKFGRVKYFVIYLGWGIGAGLIHMLGDPLSPIPAVGASGAISGILGAYLVIFPRARVLTFLMLGFFWRMLHIKAMYFLPFWLIFQNLLPFFIGGFGVAGGGVAYLAHIGGFALGLAVGYIYKKTHGSAFTYGTRYGYREDYR
jgi:membrane associated rhomboid family serine protease